MRRFALTLFASAGLCGAAAAAVPVNDGAILNKRTEDSASKVQIKTIQDQVQNYTRGIDCSVRTPGKAAAGDVKSPTTTPDAGRGGATLDKADPTIASSPAFTGSGSGTGSTGQGGQADWTAAPRAERAQTGQVIGGMETVQQQIQPNRQIFESMSQRIGQDGTLMEAMDRNSALRAQTGLTFNQAIQGTSFLAQAFNLANLATAALTSQSTRALTVPMPSGVVTAPPTITICPAGTTGQGTAASPCVASGCSTTAYGTEPSPGCVSRRFTDTTGNVSYLIEHVQTSAIASQAPLTTDELMAAVSQYQTK